jgi:hypothetical protein
MTERNCQNPECGKALNRRQKKYCSMDCQYLGRRSPKVMQIWNLRLTNPKMTLKEIAQEVGADLRFVNLVMYTYASRPAGLLKKHYRPRKPKPKAEIPIIEEPPHVKETKLLPESKHGKHVAPGWLWNLDGGVDALEKKYEHLGKRKLKK